MGALKRLLYDEAESTSGRQTDRHTGSAVFLLACGGVHEKTANESVPIQLAQCRFTGRAISNAKNMNTFFR